MCEVAETRMFVVINRVLRFSHGASLSQELGERRNIIMAKTKKIRIRLKAFDHKTLDASVAKIIEAAKSTGANVVGPVPLPTEKQVYTVLRAVHKDKDSREQFEIRTHKRLLDIVNPTAKTMDVLTNLVLPSGVDIEIKL